MRLWGSKNVENRIKQHSITPSWPVYRGPAIPSGKEEGAVVYTKVLICSIYKPSTNYWHKHKKIARLWGPLQLKNEDKSVQVLEISRNNNKQGNSARKLFFPVTSVGFSRMRQKYVFLLRLMMPVRTKLSTSLSPRANRRSIVGEQLLKLLDVTLLHVVA